MNIRARKRQVGKPVIKKDTIADWCEKNLDLNLRSYQKNIINSTNEIRLGHWGRRTGKSAALCSIAINEAFHYKKSVILLSPDTNMKKCIDSDLRTLIKLSSLKTNNTTADTITFGKGNINMYSLSGRLGNSVCGISPDVILIDEMEYISQEIIENNIMPLLISNPYNKIVCLSTKASGSENNFKGLMNIPHFYSSIKTDNSETNNILPPSYAMSHTAYNLEYTDY